MLHFVVLTCRPEHTDFRVHLAEALASDDNLVTVVRLLGNTVSIRIIHTKDAIVVPISELKRWCKTNLRAKIIYLDSTNADFLSFFIGARWRLPRGTWVFDIHDDLRYDRTGLKRAYKRAKIMLHNTLSNMSIVCVPSLLSEFPRAKILGNASFISQKTRVPLNHVRILVLSTIDDRMDHALLVAVARSNPHLMFDVYGSIRPTKNSYRIADNLFGIENISYCGGFDNYSLEEIMMKYRISFSPYSVTALTRHIDPLRYYHAFNAGHELITTPIARSAVWHDRLHVAHTSDEVRRIITELRSSFRQPKNRAFDDVTWGDKAALFKSMINEVRP